MPFNEKLADRLRKALARRKGVTEKKMFGGLAFLINGNMCCGVEKNKLVLRVGPENYESFLKKPGVRKMDFTGKPLKGFVYVSQEKIKTDVGLKKHLEPAIYFVQTLPGK